MLIFPEGDTGHQPTIQHGSFVRGIDDNGNITEAGHQASRLPVEPQIAKMLLEAPMHRCSRLFQWLGASHLEL